MVSYAILLEPYEEYISGLSPTYGNHHTVVKNLFQQNMVDHKSHAERVTKKNLEELLEKERKSAEISR